MDLQQALQALLKFRSEREWSCFHTPKNLSVSISIESAELLEHFQWKSDQEIKDYLEGEGFKEVRDELADVASYLLFLCHDLGIDLNTAVLDKLQKNCEKYPVEKSKGRHNKYTEL